MVESKFCDIDLIKQELAIDFDRNYDEPEVSKKMFATPRNIFFCFF